MPTGDVRGVRRMEAQGLGFPLVEPSGLAEFCASLITIVQPYCPPHQAPLHKSNLTAEWHTNTSIELIEFFKPCRLRTLAL